MVRDHSNRKKGFRKLLVWQRAHELVLGVYRSTKSFPDHERYGLVSQLRRASVSVPANIAEGFALGTDPQFLRHLHISQGSLAEVEYYLILANELTYLSSDEYQRLEDKRRETGYLLHRLMEKIKERSR